MFFHLMVNFTNRIHYITNKNKFVILVFAWLLQLHDYPYYANFMNAVGADT